MKIKGGLAARNDAQFRNNTYGVHKVKYNHLTKTHNK